MADLQTTAGTTLAISAEPPATYDAAGFGGLTFTTIGRISNMGDFGASFSEVTFNDIALRTVQKLKGIADMGSQTIEVGRDIDDAGQIILEAANDVDSATVDTIHSVEITYKNGTKEYYTALVMNNVTSLGDADQVIMSNTLFGITGKKVRVVAP